MTTTRTYVTADETTMYELVKKAAPVPTTELAARPALPQQLQLDRSIQTKLTGHNQKRSLAQRWPRSDLLALGRVRMLRAMSNYGPSDQESSPPSGYALRERASKPRRTSATSGTIHHSNSEPRVRRGTLRIPSDAAFRMRAGHPWVFRDTLGSRPMRDAPGEIVELFEAEGEFIGRGIYDPEGPIAVRIVTRDPNEPVDAQAILRRIRAAQQLRAALLPGEGTELTAYRVLHGEGDFLPGVTVDRYGDYLVIHLFSSSLEPFLPAICDGLEAVHKPQAIYVQKRYRPLGGEGPREPAELIRGTLAPVEIVVKEYGLQIGVDVTAPLGTGLFPDLRLGRRAVTALAKGRRVMNLFSYTGALSLAAALGGATEVVSVDLAPKSHARGRRNLQLSQMSESLHEFITGDVLAVMARMADRQRRFDMIILDPPAFAQNRGQTFSVQRDYRELVQAALPLCNSGALLCCASNAARFTQEEMMIEIGNGSGRARRHMRIVEQLGLPADFPVPVGFPDGNYLKFLVGAVL